MENLGKLEKIELRDVWPHEALNFTKWLGQEKNISLLGNEIGIDFDIESIKTEESVGDFNVDILAQEEASERKIIIENQLEATNHDHLGKLITYASGHNAEIVIWIVKEVRDEHKQAINWLNEHTDEDINFFLIRMELWKIGDSLPAPKFSVISQPNEWVKVIKKSVSELTDTKVMQLEFWNSFIEYLKEKGTSFSLRKANPQHWYDLAIGSSKAHVSFTMNTQEKLVGVEIYIPDSKELFNSLEEKKEEISNELEVNLDWQALEGKKASRIKLTNDSDVLIKENWEKDFEWMKEWGEKFQKVFSKYIRIVDRD